MLLLELLLLLVFAMLLLFDLLKREAAELTDVGTTVDGVTDGGGGGGGPHWSR